MNATNVGLMSFEDHKGMRRADTDQVYGSSEPMMHTSQPTRRRKHALPERTDR